MVLTKESTANEWTNEMIMNEMEVGIVAYISIGAVVNNKIGRRKPTSCFSNILKQLIA